MMEQDNDNKLSEESKEETSTQPLSKIELMEKAIEEMCTKHGLKCTEVKPQSCTIMFVKGK